MLITPIPKPCLENGQTSLCEPKLNLYRIEILATEHALKENFGGYRIWKDELAHSFHNE